LSVFLLVSSISAPSSIPGSSTSEGPQRCGPSLLRQEMSVWFTAGKQTDRHRWERRTQITD
jgi:hypothetical protein